MKNPDGPLFTYVYQKPSYEPYYLPFNCIHPLHMNDKPLTVSNYEQIRQKIINLPQKEKIQIDYEKTIFVHFTYCSIMKLFPKKLHELRTKYFEISSINEIIPILGTRNADVDNLQCHLVQTRPKTLTKL